MPVSSALQFFQTLNTYSHLYPNKQAEVAQQLENLINGTTVPDTIIKKEKELLRALLIQFCKLEFDLPIFLKSHVELLFHLPRYALLILTSISIFY